MVKILQPGPILLTFLISLQIQFKANSQSYYPYAEQGKFFAFDHITIAGYVGVKTYYFLGGKSFNNLLYHKLQNAHDSIFVRDDIATKRVFTYNPHSNQEELWLDFSVSTGDSVLVYHPLYLPGGSGYTVMFYIDSIKYLTTGLDCRKMVFGHTNCRQDIWIEGLGSLKGPPARYGCVTDLDWDLLTVNKGSDTIFNHTAGQFFCNPNIPPSGSQAPNTPSGE